MKNILLAILVISIIVSSCKPGDNNTIPEDLAGKKEFLKSKKAELKTLEATIEDVKQQILTLDPPKEKAALLVGLDTILPKNFERYTDVQASVLADDLVNVSSETGGRIIRLEAQENDYVKKGQLIASIDMETLDKQVAEVNKSLELATIVFDRQKRLWDQNIGSELQYLEAKNNKERIEKSLETLSSQRAKSNVYAPISGVVDREIIQQGEIASPGMPIMQILNTGLIKFVADVPENYLSSLKRGQSVELFIPALNKTYTKRITQIGRNIDPSNRTFKIEMESSNPGGIFKPNLLAEVRFKDLQIEDAIIIPINRLQQDVNGNDYVYLAKAKEGKLYARKTIVNTSESNNDEIVITDGIAEGDYLISEGSKAMSDNTLIKNANQ